MSVNAPLTEPGSLQLSPGEILSVGASIRERAVPWLMSLGVLLVYLSFPTRNYYWDGIDFAHVIENSGGLSTTLIHPHHLLYNVFGYFVYHLFDSFGWHVRAVHALQIANAFLSASCSLLLYRFLRRTFRSVHLSLVLTLLFSFSATWWKYSTDADSYIASVLFILVCLNLMLGARRPRPAAVALVHAAAMFMHQLAVIFYPAIVLGMFLNNSGLSLRRRVLLILKYSAAASSLTLAANYYCFHLQTGAYGVPDFANWLTAYLHGSNGYSFSFDGRGGILLTLGGQVKLFFGGRLNWLEGLTSPAIIFLMVLLAAIILLLVLRFASGFKALVSDVRSAAPLESRLRPPAAVCSLWACAYVIFLFLWYPYFTPYRMFYLPALIVLLGIVLVRYGLLSTPPRMRYATLFVAAVALGNFLFLIYPLSHVEKNPPLALALEMNKTWAGGTVIYYAKTNADNELFEYFNPLTSWRKLETAGAGTLESDLWELYRQGSAAWVDASALEQIRSSPDGPRWLSEHTREGRRAELVNNSYRIIFVQIFPPDYNDTRPSNGLMPTTHADEDSFK